MKKILFLILLTLVLSGCMPKRESYILIPSSYPNAIPNQDFQTGYQRGYEEGLKEGFRKRN